MIGKLRQAAKSQWGRRGFMIASAGAFAGAIKPALSLAGPVQIKADTRGSKASSLTVTEIDAHDITPEYEDWIAYQLNHYYGPSPRTVYVVHTNTGLEGLGEGSREP